MHQDTGCASRPPDAPSSFDPSNCERMRSVLRTSLLHGWIASLQRCPTPHSWLLTMDKAVATVASVGCTHCGEKWNLPIFNLKLALKMVNHFPCTVVIDEDGSPVE